MALDEVRQRRAQSFGSIATDYDRFRPFPPPEAVEWILPAGADSVVEVGAGTGALTRELVARVPTVISVEPDARMRAVLAERAPAADIREGRGEELPLPDASVDALVAASSWHWVDQEKGFGEAARVLRPGGAMGLLWTGPDRSQDWVAALMSGGAALEDELRRRNDEERRRRHRPVMPEGAPFGEPEVRAFSSTKPCSEEDLVGLCGTYSIAIILEPDERERFLASVAEFARSLDYTDGSIDLPVVCVAWRAIRLDGARRERRSQ